MRWIRPATRLAIYHRDGFACQYCGEVNPAEGLTLDHVVPRERGGLNAPSNLVACCPSCNRAKGTKRVSVFVAEVALTEKMAADILRGVRNARRRTVRRSGPWAETHGHQLAAAARKAA